MSLFRWTIPSLLLALPYSAAIAGVSYNIGSSNTEGFKLITDFMQKYVDFMTGPFAHAAIALTLIMGVILWVAMPKEGLFGVVFRVAVAGIVSLNIATWMNMFAQ